MSCFLICEIGPVIFRNLAASKGIAVQLQTIIDTMQIRRRPLDSLPGGEVMVRELMACQQDSGMIIEMFLLFYFFPLEIMSRNGFLGPFLFFLFSFLTWCVLFHRCILHIAVGSECIIMSLTHSDAGGPLWFLSL